MVFWLFVRDIKWAVVAAVGIFAIMIISEMYDHVITSSSYKNRITFYESFVPLDISPETEKKSTGGAEGQKSKSGGRYREFGTFIKDFMKDEKGVGEDKRLLSFYQFSKAYHKDSSFRYYVDYLMQDEEARSILFGNTEKIPDLIKRETNNLATLRFRWMPAVKIARVTFIYGSAVLLCIAWIVNGGLLTYFPLKSWWFYAYLILTYPASLGIGVVVAPIELGRFVIRRWRGRVIENIVVSKNSEPYKDVCSRINADRDKSREAWKNVFTSERFERRKKEQEDFVIGLRNMVEEIGGRLEDQEKKYFEAKSILRRLNENSEEIDRIQAKAEEEFDRLAAHPQIKALCVTPDNRLEIYTDYLPHILTGYVGPFKIVLKHGYELEWEGIYKVDPTSRKNPMGGGGEDRGYYCFGNARSLISKLLSEYRICDAVGVMLQSFQS